VGEETPRRRVPDQTLSLARQGGQDIRRVVHPWFGKMPHARGEARPGRNEDRDARIVKGR
jgi:hypothetical protein